MDIPLTPILNWLLTTIIVDSWCRWRLTEWHKRRINRGVAAPGQDNMAMSDHGDWLIMVNTSEVDNGESSMDNNDQQWVAVQWLIVLDNASLLFHNG